MNETITISKEAMKAADFLQPMDSRFGRSYVEQHIQTTINSAFANKDNRIKELEQRISEARKLIEKLGTVAHDSMDVLTAADKWLDREWLEEKP